VASPSELEWTVNAYALIFVFLLLVRGTAWTAGTGRVIVVEGPVLPDDGRFPAQPSNTYWRRSSGGTMSL